MADVTIYTRSWCSFCNRAKGLLESKGVEFNEIDIEEQPEMREKMIQLTGRTSVPQIFINQQAIGGCDDLFALHTSDKLNGLLAE
ncbi:glutaredoxin 3 [Psychrobium sp. 1_MG-2023]|uniref:glutaredoxin 3 n=1 Tax=Psychrobium sp. 1_MG-2023 TaxID=3062624 RepID=UPI000C32A8A0|nr:glutaredoxin 3 [Psychrobium sp. 1_MG-2023]MDP2561057.1 glutaredoxin 3 [Psychrobium sp. 1_MG-2023]PKF58348.1 glutaredoxin 3 [Alteromonadales bacterium alter-6D02]